jgi:tetratricopeptide (TPR) repeat protein
MMFKKWRGEQKAKNYFLEGEHLIAEGKYEESIKFFEKAIELDANFLDAYLRRGSIYVEINDGERGLIDLNFVIAKEPDFPAARYYRGKAYLFLEKPDLALVDVNHAMQFDPDQPANYLLRCGVYSSLEKYDQAIEDATTAIRLGFEQEGYNNRAIIFTKKADYQAAIADWTKVIEIDSNHAIAYCRRGILYSKTNDTELAIKDLTRGLKDKTQLPDSLRQESEDLLAKLQAAG